MPTQISELLDRRFAELRVGQKSLARSKYVGTDAGTFSKIINGKLGLSENRAKEWASKLYPGDFDAAADFAKQLTTARSRPNTLTVDDFCQDIVREGGAVSVDRISELFAALKPDLVHNPLVLIEYRDAPRAGPDGKYQRLGPVLGEAIASGVHVGMLVPFQTGASEGATDQRAGMSWAQKYMIDIHDACRQAYSAFHWHARSKLGKAKASEADNRLRMYIAASKTMNPGFQAKLFYVQYDIEKEGELTRHHRVLQWVSAPPRDLLIFRGDHIKPEAIRDSFFPIPHSFDGPIGAVGKDCALPHLPADNKGERAKVETEIKERWANHGLPFGESLWVSV